MWELFLYKAGDNTMRSRRKFSKFQKETTAEAMYTVLSQKVDAIEF